MSLPTILKNIVKKSQHPNALLHKFQLAKAQRTFMPNDLRISDGSQEGKFQLGEPSSSRGNGREVSEIDVGDAESVRVSENAIGKERHLEIMKIEERKLALQESKNSAQSGAVEVRKSEEDKDMLDEELRTAIRYRMLRETSRWGNRRPMVDLEQHRAAARGISTITSSSWSKPYGRRESDFKGVDRYVFGVYWYTLFLIAGVWGV